MNCVDFTDIFSMFHKPREIIMDKYFRAVGFSQLQAGKQLDSLIQTTFRTCESKYTGHDSEDVVLDCFKYFGKGIGLGLSGKMNKNKSIVLQKCFPFAESRYRIGAFNLETDNINNDKLVLFYDKKTLNQFVVKMQKNSFNPAEVSGLSVTALSAKGKVLLPLAGNKNNAAQKKHDAKYIRDFLKKTGPTDEEMFVKLEDYKREASKNIRERMRSEDFFTIVESYFQPNEESIFSYDILADIISVETIANSMTKEKLYSMTVDVTGTKLQLYINHSDLTGYPSKGMRFWGVCALHGNAVYKNKFFNRILRIFSYR